MSQDFPENIIISVTCHGKMLVTETDESNPNPDLQNEAIFFNIPPGIRLFKFSMVAPGVCNLMVPESSHFFNRALLLNKTEILETISYLVNDGSPKATELAIQFFDKLGKIFKKEDDAEQVKPLEIAKSRGVPTDPDEDDYFYTRDRGYLLSEYREIALEKVYERSYAEWRGDTTDSETAKYATYDFKINALNVPGQPDLTQLIREMRPKKHEDQDVTLSEVVLFLYGKGVKNIILFDFSCSKFKTIQHGIEISPQATRSLRRALIRDGFHGGKRKTRKNKKLVKKFIKKPKKITKTIKRNLYGKKPKRKENI